MSVTQGYHCMKARQCDTLQLAGYFYNFIFCFRLKLECEKLAQDKTEMQRHYVMVS